MIVTTDLIGFPREFRDRLEKAVAERYKLAPASLLLNASHTHSGPELRDWRASQGWDLPAEQIELGRKYSETLLGKLVELVGLSLVDLKPANLSYMHARAGFAMNRRAATGGGYSIAPNSDGPVDHDVPVLQVSGADGTDAGAAVRVCLPQHDARVAMNSAGTMPGSPRNTWRKRTPGPRRCS